MNSALSSWEIVNITFELVLKVKQDTHRGEEKKIQQYLILPMLWDSSHTVQPRSNFLCVWVCVWWTGVQFEMGLRSVLSPLSSESRISCSIPSVQMVCVHVCSSSCLCRARGRNGQYNRPVKNPFACVLFDWIYFMAALWKWPDMLHFPVLLRWGLLFVTLQCTSQKPIKIPHHGQQWECKGRINEAVIREKSSYRGSCPIPLHHENTQWQVCNDNKPQVCH